MYDCTMGIKSVSELYHLTLPTPFLIAVPFSGNRCPQLTDRKLIPMTSDTWRIFRQIFAITVESIQLMRKTENVYYVVRGSQSF